MKTNLKKTFLDYMVTEVLETLNYYASERRGKEGK